METIIEETSEKTLSIGRYLFATMRCGKHSATIVVCRSEKYRNYVRVIVHNASNRAWNGLGKEFSTITEALAAYKTEAVRSMISTAYEMALESIAA